MRKVTALILMLSIVVLCLTSCYDATEMDDTLHVVVIGIDKGISDKLRLTLQFPTMKGGAGGNGSQSGSDDNDQGDYTYVSVDAPSFFTGIDMLDTSIPRELDFKHAQIILFSEEVAKEGLISEYIAPLSRFSQLRRTAHVFVVKGKAFEFIKENKPTIGTTLSKGFEEIVKNSNDTGFFPHITFENFYESLQSPCHQPIVTIVSINKTENFKKEGTPWGTEYKTGGEYLADEIPRTGQNKIGLWGTALFHGDQMVGELNGDETRYLLMARGEFSRGSFTICDPQKPELIISLDVRSTKKPVIKVTFQESKPMIYLKVHLDANLLGVQSRINYEQPELKSLLEESFTYITKSGIEKLVDRCKSLDADVFRFGDIAAREFLTIPEFENYNWNSHFKDADVVIDVDVTIRRTGTQVINNPIPHSGGENK